ncbi:hypothetical protein DICVIV_10928 [Dictyocaulus viviparus]|uniref:Uncharacterized protein n=1 Tax=Dictyocaulus viviparus TaxID=29172 RepID=A0A0D8XEI4_DICVI|nr:hypothetical protein DICVIV_10928 [Dictyocaulus viviparus]
MGQLTSLHSKKNGTSEITSFVETDAASVVRLRRDHFMSMYSDFMKNKGILPDFFLVYEKPSNQYVDEDGDVAHEFYIEQESIEGQPSRLHRVFSNLRPKGKERYAIPRLRSDVPLVLWEVEQQT